MFGIKFLFSKRKGGEIKNGSATVKRTGRVREFKGSSANRHVDDYSIVDIETTGVFISTARIVEISALRVRDNRVVAEYTTLVNPQCHIPADATAVNHITDAMVKNARLLDDVIDEFLAFVGDDVILGYNNAGFDMNLIYDCVQDLRGKAFGNAYLDLLHAVRRSLPMLENAKLETVSKHYGFDTAGEHRALKDCYLTKACYDKLYEEFGNSAFEKSRGHFTGKGIHYTAETLALQELSKLLECVLSDGKITRDEVDSIRSWIEAHRDLSGHYPFDKAFHALDSVLEDGVITKQELADLKTIFEEIVDPVKTQKCHDKIAALEGKHICITGDFDYGERPKVEELIVSVGGIIDNSVKKATDYVVVGAQGSAAWKTGNYGAKIQKAMEWNAKGQSIKIIEEAVFIPAVLRLYSKGVNGVNGDDSD